MGNHDMVRFARALVSLCVIGSLLAPAIVLGQAQIRAGGVWGNSTAAQRPGRDEALTAILDRAFSSTRGSILERGASGWGAIGPGSLGAPFLGGGGGADPAYCTPSGTCLDSITGFSSTGLLQRTGAGAYSFVTGCATLGGACIDALGNFSTTGYLKRTGAGAYSFILPIPVADGGTACSSASGTCLDNITGFSGTGVLLRTGAGAYSFVSLGTNVQTALGTATGSVNGFPLIIASGTAALGTSAIASGACATVVTVAAASVATTDVIDAGFNADPTGTAGYTPPNVLTIYPYPTAGNVNFKVCNLTTASITPAAVTLNFKVRR